MGQPSIEKSLFKETMATSTSTDSRENNVSSQPLDNLEKVFLLPLHMIHGLMKISVKAMNQNST
jgi:hypothetical protein